MKLCKICLRESTLSHVEGKISSEFTDRKMCLKCLKETEKNMKLILWAIISVGYEYALSTNIVSIPRFSSAQLNTRLPPGRFGSAYFTEKKLFCSILGLY